MDKQLMDYRPELEFDDEAEAASWRRSGHEMANSASLLEALQTGRLPAFVQHMARSAGLPPALAAAVRDALLHLAWHLLSPAALAQPKTPARAFGMELEGLSPEDKEFELARHFVRFSGHALRRARQLMRGDPRQRAKLALALAARQHAPGLIAILNCSRAAVPCRYLSSDLKGDLTMHDIDRTTLEFGNETGYEAEQFEFGQNEWETGGGQLSESEEMELATELLSVTNEAELEQFLGGLLRKVASGASHLINSPTGKMLGGLLKGVAKKALPLAGGALGGVIGGPLGAKIGSGLASAAGNALGLEAEYEGEDREFEGARTFVKMAADTVNRVAQSPGGDPRQTAIQAATAAARRYAPGLLTQQQGQLQGQGGGAAQRAMRSQAGQAGMGGIAGATGGRGNHGRWVRQGRRIVIYGA